MNANPCASPADQPACAAACSVPAPLNLGEALARLDREAVFGTLDTGRHRFPYFTWGQGPPLLLLPGLAMPARCFALVCAQLAATFRCTAYDLPMTTRGPHLMFAELVRDPIALLDHLQIQQSYLLGFSFGSLLALAALRADPQRFPRAVLVSGFAQRPLAPAEVLLARFLRHWHAPMRSLPFYDALLRRSHFPAFADKPPELWKFSRDSCGSLPTAAVAERALLLHQTDLRPDLPHIHQPVLLVYGEDDPLVPTACRTALQQGLRHAVTVELPGCGHYAPFTHPGELAELVRDFLLPPIGRPLPTPCGRQT